MNVRTLDDGIVHLVTKDYRDEVALASCGDFCLGHYDKCCSRRRAERVRDQADCLACLAKASP